MFKGLFTAIITPFLQDGSLDESALSQLIDNQIEARVDGLVILGTTGESPTISTEEHNYIISYCVEKINGRCQVIAGTGSNSTREAIYHSLHAQKVGVDGLLIVNPYYNKPTQKGLYEHFTAIADAVDTPIILYNIAGRTGVNLETPTLLKLATLPTICGVKEASGDMNQILEVIRSVPEGFTVLSGDDELTLEMMKQGGHGVVSVLANLLPTEMKNLIDTCATGSWAEADGLHGELQELFAACFIETNPQPIKTLLAHTGRCQEVFRLPLTTMEEHNRTSLINVWNKFSAVMT